MPTQSGGHVRRQSGHAHAKPWACHPGSQEIIIKFGLIPRRVVMRYLGKLTGLLLTVAAAGWCGTMVQAQQGCATCSTCGSCETCLPEPARCHCPPPFCHTQEGPPCIHYKCGCPRPVCDPCNLPHYGY